MCLFIYFFLGSHIISIFILFSFLKTLGPMCEKNFRGGSEVDPKLAQAEGGLVRVLWTVAVQSFPLPSSFFGWRS